MTDFLKRKAPPKPDEFPDQAAYNQARIEWFNAWPLIDETTNKQDALQTAREEAAERGRPCTAINPSGERSRNWTQRPWQIREYRGPA